MSSNGYLALFLDAPMQSWGMESRFDTRSTLPFPSRSAVTGMIAAAQGIDRSDHDALKALNELGMTMLSFRERSGRLLRDFQTVGGGNFCDCRSKPTNVAGKAKANPVISHREYLTDARFGVILSGKTEKLHAIGRALRDPVWGVWFGRKSCVPCSPVFRGIFATEQEAVGILTEAAKAQVASFWRETEVTALNSLRYFDRPEDFATRKFGLRAIIRESSKQGERDAADGTDLS